MCRDELFRIKGLYGGWKIWWRLPLAMVLVMGAATFQHLVVVGVERMVPSYLVMPAMVGGGFGLLWSFLAAYRSRLGRLVGLMRHLAEDASDVLVLRCQDSFLFLSPRIRDLTGYEAEVFEMTPGFFEQLIHEEDRERWREYQMLLWEGELDQVRTISFRLVTSLRGVVWVQHEASCFVFNGQRLCRCVLRDVSDEMHLKEALKRLAEEDALTGLPNRAVLVERCATLSKPGVVTCVMVDIGGLRHINVRFGIEIGDFVLQTIAERLRKLTEYPDHPGLLLVARLVGDNFALIFQAPQKTVEPWISEHMVELSKPAFSEKLKLFVELHLETGYFETHVADHLTRHQVEQMLRAAYLKIHPMALSD